MALRHDAKMQCGQICPQDCTDTIRDDYDLLSEKDIDCFIIKINTLNACLNSLHRKSDLTKKSRNVTRLIKAHETSQSC